MAVIDEQLESIDNDGLGRVVSYLGQRYAPVNVAVDDAPLAEDAA